MDKNKSEKLKEILNQTISQEEIEKKLKKEIKNAATKKAEQKKKEDEEQTKTLENVEAEKENIKIEIKEEHLEKTNIEKKQVVVEENTKVKNNQQEPSTNKEVLIPNVRNKKKEHQDINILLYLVGAIALLLFLVVVYLFIYKEDLSKSNLDTKPQKISTEKFYEEKVKENQKEIKKDILAIQNDTVIKEPMIKVQNDIKEIKKVKPKEIEKIVIKEKIVTKVVNLDKKNFKTYYNSSKYNSLKCYNFKAGDIFPTNACKNNLQKFLKENKKAIRFEIIPVISENDNIIFNKMKENIKKMDKTFQNKVEEYMYRGLSRERVLETSWFIRDVLGEDTILTPTNYYVKSKKNNKGIIVKAYH